VRRFNLQTGQVSELVLKGVPISRASVREGGFGASWPVLPGTVFLGSQTLTLSGAGPWKIELALDLPSGWHLTAGAPSALRLEVAGAQVDVALVGPRTSLALPRLPAGSHPATLRLLYYVCQEAGACRVRSVERPLRLQVGGTTGKSGDPTPVVWDRFRP